jgi:hypothetical protein
MIRASLPDAANVRFRACGGDEARQLFVHRAGKDHFGDFHGRLVRHPQAVQELRFDAGPFEHAADLRAAAMDDHRMDADQLEQNDVGGEARGGFAVAHGVAAIFDDHGFAVVDLDEGQRLGQRARGGCAVLQRRCKALRIDALGFDLGHLPRSLLLALGRPSAPAKGFGRSCGKVIPLCAQGP